MLGTFCCLDASYAVPPAAEDGDMAITRDDAWRVVAFVLVLLGTRPEAAAAYNSVGGAVLVVAGLAVTLVAYRIMIALGRLPEEGRWFR